METSDEMKKWVAALTISEKRFIKRIGHARAGGRDSQQLQYFDWLNITGPADEVPADAKFMHNLPTISNRLKDTILDGLRLLYKDDTTDAMLRATLDEIAILRQKRLLPAVQRQLRRAKKLALERSRYDVALQCIQIEQEMALAEGGGDVVLAIETLRAEEQAMLQKQAQLAELRYQQNLLQAMAALKLSKLAADPGAAPAFDSPFLVEMSDHGNYLESLLATNVLAIQHLLAGTPQLALPRAAALLRRWQSQPEWQSDQSALLLFFCNCYQSLCFFSPLSLAALQAHLALIPDFASLPEATVLDFQRMLYHNQFNLALNTGQLERIPGLIAEIGAWLDQHAAALSVARALPFLHNFMMAEFLQGQWPQALRWSQRIQQMPQRHVREDIREFARMLQAVLYLETDDARLDEYALRALRRHWQKHAREDAFALAVFAYLDRVISRPDLAAQQASLANLVAQLETAAEGHSGAMPLLGLTEMRLWAKARQSGRSLREVFLEVVHQNIAQG